MWYRVLWRFSDAGRRLISRAPAPLRAIIASAVAVAVYWPLPRVSRLLERAGVRVDVMPLSYYRNSSLYTMTTDALDRFGTRLEQRFTKSEIAEMMASAGLRGTRFSDGMPYWVAVGGKRL